MTTREERRLARLIIETVKEIALCPKDNLKRFNVLKSRLTTHVSRFKKLTGRDTLGEELSQIVAYGTGKE